MTKIKKISSVVITTTLVIGIFSMQDGKTVHAMSDMKDINYSISYEIMSKEYKVNVRRATVRKSPSSLAFRLGTLKKGTIVKVSNTSNGWAQINYNNGIGYVKLSELKEVESIAPIKTGTVTVKYLDTSTKAELSTSDYLENLELKTHSYAAKNIEGYILNGNEVQNITLTEANPNVIIEFLYTKKEEPEIPAPEYNSTKGIFSWKNTQCSQTMRADTHYWVDKLQLNEVYQANIFRLTSSETEDFVKDLRINKKVSIYDLTGDPSWYNKPEEFIKRIDRVKNYNNTVKSESKVKGVVFDVEPWVLGDGNWSQATYANTIKKAYEYAQSVGVEIVIVIPFWLDTINSEIIIQNSDKTIVMNYNIKDPVKFIKEEIELAKKYNKKISTAAETKKTDPNHGVDSTTTYYYVGLDRLKQDWTNIHNTYGYDKLEFTLHDFNSVKEFIK